MGNAPSAPQAVPSPPVEQLLQSAVRQHEAGRLQEAKAIYQQVLRQAPDNADALHLSGLVAYQTGRFPDAVVLIERAARRQPSAVMYFNLAAAQKAQGNAEAAVDSYRHAIRLNPGHAEAYNNLGNTLKQLGRFDEAADNLRKALALRPAYAEGHNNLGVVLREQGLLEEAAACYRKALSLRPDYAEAYNNLGNALKDMDKLDEAIASFRKALALQPDNAETLGNLGGVLKAQEQLDEALACFRRQLLLAPDSHAARHHIASLTGENTERAPAQYVAKLFDDYAEKFDTHLQQDLGYDIPRKMATLVTQHFSPPPEKWRILDLGCGTGLAGEVLAPYAQHLVGVDLSAKMLDKARERKLYQRLEQADLLAMMQGEPDGEYHVVVAADVFVYLGKLDEIIAEVRRLLRSGGIFAFSVEALMEDASQAQYRLASTGRYAHAAGYMAVLADTNRFTDQIVIETPIRMENGKPVDGYLALWNI